MTIASIEENLSKSMARSRLEHVLQEQPPDSQPSGLLHDVKPPNLHRLRIDDITANEACVLRRFTVTCLLARAKNVVVACITFVFR